jgi:hypothetical protein
LRKFVRGLEGKDQETFDLEALLGKVCMLNVSHNQVGDRMYANIDSAAPLPKGMSEPEAVNEQFILNYTDKWDEARFEKLPDFLKEQMKQSDEYKRKTFEGAEKASPLDDESQIPF